MQQLTWKTLRFLRRLGANAQTSLQSFPLSCHTKDRRLPSANTAGVARLACLSSRPVVRAVLAKDKLACTVVRAAMITQMHLSSVDPAGAQRQCLFQNCCRARDEEGCICSSSNTTRHCLLRLTRLIGPHFKCDSPARLQVSMVTPLPDSR